MASRTEVLLSLCRTQFYTDTATVTSLQAVAVRVTCRKALTICSLYLPPSAEWSINDIADLLQQIPSPVLLLGDFNAHNPLWGSNKLDSKGKIIEDILLKFNLSVLNSGSVRCQDMNSCSSQTYIYPATKKIKK